MIKLLDQVPPIFSIYICGARVPLFLTIFLSLATSKIAIYSQYALLNSLAE